jgi:predicted RNase H-like HicB family nuclease
MKKNEKRVPITTSEEYIDYLSKYIADLPDACPHKATIKTCKEAIILLSNAIKLHEKTIDIQDEIIKRQKECIGTHEELEKEYRKMIKQNEIK